MYMNLTNATAKFASHAANKTRPTFREAAHLHVLHRYMAKKFSRQSKASKLLATKIFCKYSKFVNFSTQN